MSKEASLIAVDWGSTQFRACLLDGNGTIIGKTENNRGIFTNRENSFKDVLYSSCGSWFDCAPGIPVFMCGMIGSHDGWVETEYLKCPITVQELGRRLVKVPDAPHNPIFIVPGITSDAFAFADVMRGEETQVFGLSPEARLEGIACLPGTHSKWVSVDGNRINHFTTFLTGELYASIKTAGSIQPVIKHEDFDEDAFKEGVRISREPGGLSHHVFSVRARLMAGESSCGIHASYLSGLLIGAEISSALTLYPDTGSVNLAGNARLTRQYGLAFSLFDIAATSTPAHQASASGLWKLAVVSGQVIHKDHAG